MAQDARRAQEDTQIHEDAQAQGGPVTVRYFAGARAAAGTPEEVLPAGGQPLAELVGELTARNGPQLAKVLAVASFLVDGVIWRDQEARLPAGATLDVLPPFAGG